MLSVHKPTIPPTHVPNDESMSQFYIDEINNLMSNKEIKHILDKQGEVGSNMPNILKILRALFKIIQFSDILELYNDSLYTKIKNIKAVIKKAIITMHEKYRNEDHRIIMGIVHISSDSQPVGIGYPQIQQSFQFDTMSYTDQIKYLLDNKNIKSAFEEEIDFDPKCDTNIPNILKGLRSLSRHIDRIQENSDISQDLLNLITDLKKPKKFPIKTVGKRKRTISSSLQPKVSDKKYKK